MNIVTSFTNHYLFLVVIIGSMFSYTSHAQEVGKPVKEGELSQIESQLKIDSLLSTIDTIAPTLSFKRDSLTVTDSIKALNKAQLDSLNAPIIATEDAQKIDKKAITKQWRPNPTRATWYGIIFPGGGQIYNRKYWKLPIFYGGFAGCIYALNWNDTMYKDYAQSYRDLMDGNPNTNSHLELFPPNANIDESRLQSILKNRKDRFRRYRDLSVIAFIGVYILSVIDAYVDAELSNFDITPDLSMRIEPTMINSVDTRSKSKSVGLQCKFTF